MVMQLHLIVFILNTFELSYVGSRISARSHSSARYSSSIDCMIRYSSCFFVDQVGRQGISVIGISLPLIQQKSGGYITGITANESGRSFPMPDVGPKTLVLTNTHKKQLTHIA
jgi:hypothetical protein